MCSHCCVTLKTTTRNYGNRQQVHTVVLVVHALLWKSVSIVAAHNNIVRLKELNEYYVPFFAGASKISIATTVSFYYIVCKGSE
jgi:hypothetical protein